jgi:hypothetical protein
MNAARIFILFVFGFSLTGCSGLPEYVVLSTEDGAARTAPKIGALMANLKCQLRAAANSEEPLPYYKNEPNLEPRKDKPVEADRAFTLKNLFQEIEYVGAASFSLDVTETSNITPNNTWTTPLTAPAVSAALAVNGQFQETPHRNLTFTTSVDFERLVANPGHEGVDEQDAVPEPMGECGAGRELTGDLGLKETIAAAMVAYAMNDISVYPGLAEKQQGAGGVQISIDSFQKYAFGQITATVEFTIVRGINGGPTWTLQYYKGPGPSLLNLNRTVKDTLTISLVPVCIRRAYHSTGINVDGFNYKPRMIHGTPYWANFLPQCPPRSSIDYGNKKVSALVAARNANDINRAVLLQQGDR